MTLPISAIEGGILTLRVKDAAQSGSGSKFQSPTPFGKIEITSLDHTEVTRCQNDKQFSPNVKSDLKQTVKDLEVESYADISARTKER